MRFDGTAQCWGSGSAPVGQLSTISAGSSPICGLRPDGTVACGGTLPFGNADPARFVPPTGTFSRVSSGDNASCGVRSDGSLECWGYTSAHPTLGSFIDTTIGETTTCGLRANGTGSCWSPATQSDTWVSPYLPELSTGRGHACRLDIDGTPVCWGDNSSGQATPLSTFAPVAISAGADHTCAMTPWRSVACWGSNAHGQSSIPLDNYMSFAAGDGFTCVMTSFNLGRTESGRIECFGTVTTGPFSFPHGYSSLTAGGAHACVIGTDGASVVCWGDNSAGQATPPAGSFSSVSAGGAHTCALATDRSVHCWGSNSRGQATPPSGAFVQVSAGNEHTCAVDTAGRLACWGNNDFGQASPPNGEFVAVSAGGSATCALDSDGNTVCFGDALDGMLAPPAPAKFAELAASDSAVCGIRDDGSGFCNDGSSVAGPLHGVSASTGDVVGAAPIRACALRADDTLVCFGSGNTETPPDGAFVGVALGKRHTCALRADGSVTCWGNYKSGDLAYGEAMPPYGLFSQVAVGFAACGLHPDGSGDCWGSLDPVVNSANGPKYPGPYTKLAVGGWSPAWLDPNGQIVASSFNSVPGNGPYIDLAVQEYDLCALTTAHTIDCASGTAPEGTFKSLTSTDGLFCGLHLDGTVTCWQGAEAVATPAVTLETIVMAGLRVCGMRSDASAVCWNATSNPSVEEKPGPLKAIAPSSDGECVMHLDGTVACRGTAYDSGWSIQPTGVFASITSDCGIRPGGTVSCWGEYRR